METNLTEQIHLSDYWNVVQKRKKLILGVLLVTVALAMIISFTMKPVYQSASRLSIERESTTSPLTGQSIEYIDSRSQILSFNTHFKLITSKPVLANLLDELERLPENSQLSADEEGKMNFNLLSEVVSIFSNAMQRMKDNVRLLLGKNQIQLSEQELRDLKINDLQEQIRISNERDTRLLTINVMDIDPERSALIANLLAKKYVEFDLASRLESSNQNLEWLQKEVYTMKKKLEDDERRFYEYKQSNKVFSIEGRQKVIDQKIAELNNEYLVTRNRRQELEVKLNEILKQYDGTADVAYIRSILDNKAIDDIYASLTSLELEMSRLSKVFKAKHPKILQVSSEIAKVKAKLKAELAKEIENLKVERSVLANKEKVMEQTISEFEEDALDTSSKELDYTILERNMSTSQQLYDTLVAKVKESGIVSGGASSNIRIVEHASVPINPVKPNKKKNLLLSIVLGLFGGVGLAFFFEYLDQTVRNEDDVLTYLELPVLSVIPVADKTEKGGYY